MDKTRNIRHGNVETLPIFAQQLNDVRCCDGDSVRLECHVEGKPDPQIVWQKDGRQLNETSEDFTTNYDGERATLTIKRVYPEDEGEYVCIATNRIGERKSAACIIVDGEFSHFVIVKSFVVHIQIFCCSSGGKREFTQSSIDSANGIVVGQFNTTINATYHTDSQYVTDGHVLSIDQHQCEQSAATQSIHVTEILCGAAQSLCRRG